MTGGSYFGRLPRVFVQLIHNIRAYPLRHDVDKIKIIIDSQVLFRKIFGHVTVGQVSLFFSFIGLLNATLLWPLCLVFYFTGIEVLQWDNLPWPILFGAGFSSLGKCIMHNCTHPLQFDRSCFFESAVSLRQMRIKDFSLGSDRTGWDRIGI